MKYRSEGFLWGDNGRSLTRKYSQWLTHKGIQKYRGWKRVAVQRSVRLVKVTVQRRACVQAGMCKFMNTCIHMHSHTEVSLYCMNIFHAEVVLHNRERSSK